MADIRTVASPSEKTPTLDNAREKPDETKTLPNYRGGSVDTPRDEVGYVQDFAPTRDGMELHPKPTKDLLDPLNFSKGQKWTSLGIVMWM